MQKMSGSDSCPSYCSGRIDVELLALHDGGGFDRVPRGRVSRSFAPPFAWPLRLSAVSLIEVSSSPTQRLAQSATVAMHST